MNKRPRDRKPMDQQRQPAQPHITHPIEEARSAINRANHHIWRAGHIDSAYEADRALACLKQAIGLIQAIQRDYAIAAPTRINTSLPPTDPTLCPGDPDDE